MKAKKQAKSRYRADVSSPNKAGTEYLTKDINKIKCFDAVMASNKCMTTNAFNYQTIIADKGIFVVQRQNTDRGQRDTLRAKD